jgi:O-antigen ligase
VESPDRLQQEDLEVPSAGSNRSPRPPVEPSSSRPDAAEVGFFFLLAFLFLAFSRASDLLVSGWYLPFLTSVGALVCALLAGTAIGPFKSRAGVALTLFSAWMLFTVPFSFWPGGSVEMLRKDWSKSFMTFVIVAGLVRKPRHCCAVARTLGAAGLAVTVLAFLEGDLTAENRLALPAGTLANPNELSTLLLTLAPFVWFIIAADRRWSPWRIAGVLGLPALLLVVIRTGSRAALFAGLGLAVVALWRSPWRRRVRVAVLGALGLLLLAVALPESIASRYATTFGDAPATGDGHDEAVGSREARIGILKQSMRLTAAHPLVGVGPGQFQPAAAELAGKVGEEAYWRETHNTFTQVSSETGLPGLVLYVIVLLTTCKNADLARTGLSRSGAALPALASGMLFYSFILFLGNAAFNSLAYQLYVPALAGMATGFANAARANEPSAGAPGPGKPARESRIARTQATVRVSSR